MDDIGVGVDMSAGFGLDGRDVEGLGKGVYAICRAHGEEVDQAMAG